MIEKVPKKLHENDKKIKNFDGIQNIPSKIMKYYRTYKRSFAKLASSDLSPFSSLIWAYKGWSLTLSIR